MHPPDRVGPRARRLIRSVVSAGGSQSGILLVGLVVTPVLVGVLGFERYGLWALVGVLVNYVGLADLGLGASFVRFLARYHERGEARRFNTVVRLGLLFYAAFAVPVLATVLVLRRPLLDALSIPAELRGEVSFLLLGVTAVFLIRSIFVVFRAAIAAVERIDVNNHIALAVAGASGLGAVLVVSLGFGLKGLTINALATAVLTIIAQTVAAYRVVPLLRLRPFRIDWKIVPEVLGYGMRLQATRLAELLNGQVDKVVLGFMVGAASVGLYDLGMKLSLLAAVLPSLLLPVVLPTSSLLAARGDRDRLEALYRRGTKYVGWVLAPAVVFLLVAAPELLRLWIGEGALPQAATVTRLLVLGSAPLLALGVSRLVARGIGVPELEMWASLGMAGANLVLSVALVSWLGAIGAPLGSCCAGLLGGAIFLVAFNRKIATRYGFRPLRPLAGPAAVAALAGLAALASMKLAGLLDLPAGRTGALLELTLAAVPFGLVYLVVLMRRPFLDEYDRRVAREAWALARGAHPPTEMTR